MHIKSSVPRTFFEEEERLGYTISSKMKRVWAIQMDLLLELQRICEKYNLTYYADSGTLLGAIRHGGYIPWDDDIDIVMKRPDYEKLISVADKELCSPYFLQSSMTEHFPRGYSRLRNSDSTAITLKDNGKNINHGIFIDIFPLDNIPDNNKALARWLIILKLLNGCLNVGSYKRADEYSSILKRLKYCLCRMVMQIIGYETMIQSYKKMCCKYNKTHTQRLSYVAYSNGKKKHIWESECFEKSHIVPFEYIMINIPDGYDSRLRTEYGDYHKIVRANTTHGEMILEPDIPYKDYLSKHSEKEIKETLSK